MFDNNDGPKDWEIKDEEPPETLKQKWEREEAEGSKKVVCPSCKKETPDGNLTCIFCGAKIIRSDGVWSGFLSTIRNFLTGC